MDSDKNAWYVFNFSNNWYHNFLIVSGCCDLFLCLLVAFPHSTAYVCHRYALQRLEQHFGQSSAHSLHGVRYCFQRCDNFLSGVFLGVFYYFNSMLNPFLYSVMSKRFRRGFSDLRGSINHSFHVCIPKESNNCSNGKPHISLSPSVVPPHSSGGSFRDD